MKLNSGIVFAVLMAVLAASCASPRRGGPGGGFGLEGRGPEGGSQSARIDRPSALLAAAREQQGKEGCAKAAPAYRIVASYGDGYEIAQYELGACLLEMPGASDAETALFRQEGVFWLSRAAWAGDPRAQGKLIEALSGVQGYAAAHIAPDPEAALMWSIIYMSNGSRDTYALRPAPSPVTDHLARVLSVEAKDRAHQKAVEFSRVTMEAFVTPPMPQNAGKQDGRGGPPGGGGRPPRRQIETARP